MSPLGYSESWPALRNQRPNDAVRHLDDELKRRIAAASPVRRAGQWLYRWLLYKPFRWIRHAFAAVINTFATSPVKTIVDVLTGVPIALLAWPFFRDWISDHAAMSIALGAIIVLRVIFTAYLRNDSRKARRQSVRQTQTRALLPIEMVLGHALDAQGGYPLGPHLLTVAVKNLLDAMILLTSHGMQIPRDVALHANLMLAMEVKTVNGAQVPGLGIVEYNTQRPAEPSWTKVIAGDLIAGTVLITGKLSVMEDTRDPAWWGVYRGVRSRSFTSFPLTAPDGSVIGVVNLDANKSMVFKLEDVRYQLWPVLAPPLRLLSQLLHANRKA
jgi:hypothetical protein